MTNSEFARRIKTSKQNVQDIFTRQSVDTKLLSRISDVLNYDFFEYFIKEKRTSVLSEPEPEYKIKKKSLTELSLNISINDESKRKEILTILFGDNVPPYLLK